MSRTFTVNRVTPCAVFCAGADTVTAGEVVAKGTRQFTRVIVVHFVVDASDVIV